MLGRDTMRNACAERHVLLLCVLWYQQISKHGVVCLPTTTRSEVESGASGLMGYLTIGIFVAYTIVAAGRRLLYKGHSTPSDHD